MKWMLVIILLVFITSSSYSETLFIDDFNDETQIPSKSNIIIQGGNVFISNISASNKGYIMSILITRQSNEQWNLLTTDYEITNKNPPYPHPKLIIKVLDKNTNELLSNQNPSQNKSINLANYNEIKINTSIISKAILDCESKGYGTPILNSWEVSVNMIESSIITKHSNTFYGAPSPFKIDDTSSFIRLYYKDFKKNCSVTLKIYDTNYSLIRNITDKKRYSSGHSLNETWNGKNGNNVQVMSGVYVAVIKIKNTDGTSENPDPFIFAVIR